MYINASGKGLSGALSGTRSVLGAFLGEEAQPACVRNRLLGLGVGLLQFRRNLYEDIKRWTTMTDAQIEQLVTAAATGNKNHYNYVRNQIKATYPEFRRLDVPDNFPLIVGGYYKDKIFHWLENRYSPKEEVLALILVAKSPTKEELEDFACFDRFYKTVLPVKEEEKTPFGTPVLPLALRRTAAAETPTDKFVGYPDPFMFPSALRPEEIKSDAMFPAGIEAAFHVPVSIIPMGGVTPLASFSDFVASIRDTIGRLPTNAEKQRIGQVVYGLGLSMARLCDASARFGDPACFWNVLGKWGDVRTVVRNAVILERALALYPFPSPSQYTSRFYLPLARNELLDLARSEQPFTYEDAKRFITLTFLDKFETIAKRVENYLEEKAEKDRRTAIVKMVAGLAVSALFAIALPAALASSFGAVRSTLSVYDQIETAKSLEKAAKQFEQTDAAFAAEIDLVAKEFNAAAAEAERRQALTEKEQEAIDQAVEAQKKEPELSAEEAFEGIVGAKLEGEVGRPGISPWILVAAGGTVLVGVPLAVYLLTRRS